MQKTSHSFSRSLYELLSSMRFAISLLSVLAIASVVGTVLKQSEPYQNYVFQFGQFWFKFFEILGLYDVYHSGWFLTMLSFLVISTSTCIYRNAPLMLREMKNYREHATESSLRHFAHQAEFATGDVAAAAQRLCEYLAASGYRFKLKQQGEQPDADILLAAKLGGLNRLGYIFTHTAIVIICIGGLMDGNIPLKLQQLLGYKKIETRDIPQSRVPAASRLSSSNLSFRGSITIPEGSSADVVFLNVADGYLVQELPFEIALKKFTIEYYAGGQPKSFASAVVITDKETRRQIAQTISVNHPLSYRGIAIYQAGFGDGGSRLSLSGWNLLSPVAAPFSLQGVVKQSVSLGDGKQLYTAEFGDFQRFNVQSFAEPPQPKGFWKALLGGMGAGVPPASEDLRDIGPSFQYRLRDAQGQAKEFENYMLPVQFDQRWYLLSGVRAAPNEPFRYVRFPLDEQNSIAGFMRLRAVLFDQQAYPEIARRFARAALKGEAAGETMRSRLESSTVKILEVFGSGGYDALARLIEQAVPEPEREKAARTYLKVLENAALAAYQMSRERTGLKPAQSDTAMQFVRDSLNSISDIFLYGAPVYLQLTGYEEVQASGLQLTRSPGKNVVYLGSLLLVAGVFAMFYIRERRLWLLVKPQTGRVLFAMSSNRKTLDFEREFERHKQNLADLLKE